MNKMNAIAAAMALAALGNVARGDGIDAALAERQWTCGAHVLSLSVYDRYYDEIVRRDLAADQAWTALKTPDEFRKHQRRLRDGMVAALGGFPERTPLNLRVTETVQRNGYSIE